MTVNPDYMVARYAGAHTEREQRETQLFTAHAVLSGIPVEFLGIIPDVFDRDFSRYQYAIDGDVLARPTRGKK